MEFGSKYVYCREQSDEELSEEEMEDGVMAHASRFAKKMKETRAVADSAVVESLSAQSSERTSVSRVRINKKRKFKKADTNVMLLSLGSLQNGAPVATGDALCCKGCRAYYSITSLVSVASSADSSEGGSGASSAAPALTVASEEASTGGAALPSQSQQSAVSAGKAEVAYHPVWKCEFCGVVNDFDLADEELPTSDTMDYVLEVPSVAATASTGTSNVIFCMDTSGSMCVTTEVAGSIKLKGAESRDKQNADLHRFAEGSQQTFGGGGGSRNVTYISRLQCVQAAVDAQIATLVRESPNVVCGMVAFSGDVRILGDGTQEEVVIAGDRLNNYEEVVAVARGYNLTSPVSDSHLGLSKKLYGLEESGPTALGPALVAAVTLASTKPGSKVIVCTDGLANVGLGAMDTMVSEEEKDAVEAFYRRVAALAVSSGVTISVVSIAGSDCKMEFLGILADETAGLVDIVDPLNLTTNFGNILADPVVATNVTVSFIIHRGLKFVNTAQPVEGNTYIQVIGNATSTSDISLEYAVRNRADLQEGEVIPEKLPFQVQIHFTKLDGMKCVRVISHAKETTEDRTKAEEAVNVDVIGVNNMRQNARLAQEGDYTQARLNAFRNNDLLVRTAKSVDQQRSYSNWLQQTEALDSVVRTQQHAEWDQNLNLSDDEGEGGEGGEASHAKKALKKKARSHARGDEAAKFMYNQKSVGSKNYYK